MRQVRREDDGRRAEIVALYDTERAPMVRLAYLLTGSVSIAEDVVQDAFIRLYEGPGEIRRPGAYLRRTVINLCHSHHRHEGVERRWRDRQPRPELVVPPDVDDLWRTICVLPPRQREALVLRFYLDMKVPDIADALGTPLGTVKSDIHRGLAALAQQVER